MAKATLKEKLQYRFDKWMAKGVLALIGLLTVITVLTVSVIAAVVSLFKLHPANAELDFFEAFWISLMRTLDAGTMGADSGQSFRIAMLVVTLAGLVIVASLIGIVSNAFNAKVEELRKGKSRVLEENHTLILGWNSKIFQIIRELVIANESRTKPKIVILADKDKVEMEDEIHRHVKHLKNTEVVVRSGNPMSLVDLRITSHEKARSILILPPDGVEFSDSVAIKTTMALLASPSHNDNSYHIVTEISDSENLEIAKLVGGSEVTWVQADDLIARLIVQTSRQSGLSAVFTDLLDFEGSELYLHPARVFDGIRYQDAVNRMTQGCLIGVIRDGEVNLNPQCDFVLLASDFLIVIAEDDASIKFGQKASFESQFFTELTVNHRVAESFLVIGFGSNTSRIVSELAGYLAPGSTITVVSDADVTLPERAGIGIEVVSDNPAKRQTIDGLDLSRFQHAILLADDSLDDIQRADAQTLLTLLHIREVVRSRGLQLNIVTEMLDDHNRELAETTKADDFIVSDKLVSYMLAQLEENDELSEVFSALFSVEGPEIALRPIEEYVQLGVGLTFNTVVAAAIAKGDSAIGHRIRVNQDEADQNWGVELAPDRFAERTYKPGDKVVVLTTT